MEKICQGFTDRLAKRIRHASIEDVTDQFMEEICQGFMEGPDGGSHEIMNKKRYSTSPFVQLFTLEFVTGFMEKFSREKVMESSLC